MTTLASHGAKRAESRKQTIQTLKGYTMKIELSGKEILLAVNALHLAAEQYAKDAHSMELVDNVRLMQQFREQHLQAKDLAEKLENQYGAL